MEVTLLYQKQVQPSELRNQLNVSPDFCRRFINIRRGEKQALVYFTDISNGIQWAFDFRTRLAGIYPKPTISRATWGSFARAKRIRVGDVISFYKYGEKLLVRVQREVRLRLMGAEIGTRVEI